MTGIRLLLLAGWLGCGIRTADAATTCSLGAIAGMNIANYVERVAAPAQPMSVMVNCTRAAITDPPGVTYTLTFDAGSNNNRAAATVAGTSYAIAYAKGSASTCTPALTTLSGSFSWSGASSTGMQSTTVGFYGCVGAQAGMAAGTYTDSIVVTLTDNLGSAPVIGTVPVAITLEPKCTVSSPPARALAFDYAAFRTSALVVPLAFGVTCTNTTPYTMSLDVPNGVAAGLAYTLALSAPAATGTGLSQSYTVSGTMAPNQPGDCTSGCSVSNVHTITIQY